MLKRFLCLAGLALVCACLASTATADPGLTLRVGTPDLAARVLITVPLAVSCSPFDPSLTLFSEGYSVSVEQASGKAIAHGSAFNMTFLPVLLFPCDGAGHTFTTNVQADPAGPPFHGGQAVLSASVFASAGTSCGPGCFFTNAQQTGSLGPTVIKMH